MVKIVGFVTWFTISSMGTSWSASVDAMNHPDWLTFSEYTPISKQPRWPFLGEWWIFPNIHHHLIYRRLDMEDLASCGGQQSGKSTIEFSLPCWMTMLSPDKPNWIAGHGSPQIYPPSFSNTKTYYKYTLWSYSPKFSPSHSLGSVKTHVEKYKETDPNRAHMIPSALGGSHLYNW